MRPANLGTTTCASVFATLLALIGPVVAQEATEETTRALPQENSTPPVKEGGAAVDQAAALKQCTLPNPIDTGEPQCHHDYQRSSE